MQRFYQLIEKLRNEDPNDWWIKRFDDYGKGENLGESERYKKKATVMKNYHSVSDLKLESNFLVMYN